MSSLRRANGRFCKSWVALLVVPSALYSLFGEANACPFCTALKPTLSQRREEAAVVAIGECLESGPKQATFRIHQVLKGKELLLKSSEERLDVAVDTQLKPGSLAILFAMGSAEKLTWTCQPANELGLSYFVKAPTLRTPIEERLRYFARFLEHANPLAAEDAYNEFGYAPYDVVERAAEQLPVDQLRSWLSDPKVRPEWKGFYGLALGLAGRRDDRDRNAAFLRELILAPADDFRAGFDGWLAGYLVLTGEEGLELIERQFLANPVSREGDVRHAMSALRFYQEFGHDIPQQRLSRAMRLLLKRPEFAAAAIIDLARWQDWDAFSEVAALYAAKPSPPAATRRAIVGFLVSSPQRDASMELDKLRRFDPEGVAKLEEEVRLESGAGRKN